MRAAWRLSINGLAGRRNRTLLLIGAVALATSLVAAVTCALGSLAASMEREVTSRLGRADARIKEVAGARFSEDALEAARRLPEVELAAGRFRSPVTLRNPASGVSVTVIGQGVEPELEARLVDEPVDQGRGIRAPGEVSLDAGLASQLKASLGDTLEVERFGP